MSKLTKSKFWKTKKTFNAFAYFWVIKLNHYILAFHCLFWPFLKNNMISKINFLGFFHLRRILFRKNTLSGPKNGSIIPATGKTSPKIHWKANNFWKAKNCWILRIIWKSSIFKNLQNCEIFAHSSARKIQTRKFQDPNFSKNVVF